MPKQQTVVAVYIPVLHRGYIEFLQKQKPDVIYLFDHDLLQLVDYIRKDLRAIDPQVMQAILAKGLAEINLTKTIVSVIDGNELSKLADQDLRWVLPNEDVSHEIAQKYLTQAKVVYKPVFLRWDRENTTATKETGPVSTNKVDQQRMQLAYKQANRSSDIWRRVGAALFSEKGDLLYAKGNQPATNQHSPWMEGDPRNSLSKGVGIEMSAFFHAEASLIAQAAKDGKSLLGTSIYVTTFPCPPCAMLVANSGIKHCYYAEGYAVLDGDKIMKTTGVSVSKVAVKPPRADPDEFIPYKKPRPSL